MTDHDPFDSPTSREELIEGRRWKSVVQETIFSLEVGDVILVETARKDVGEVRLTITGHEHGDRIVTTDNGRELLLVPSYSYNGYPGEPWLRRKSGHGSLGRIEELEVAELVES